jgi:uncharacterized membrane protein
MGPRLRRYFITGLIVFLPIAITFSVLRWLFLASDSFLGRLLTLIFGQAYPGLGLVATIAVIFFIGVLTTNVLGRRLVGWFDRLMLRIPLARSIYSATKQLSDSIILQRRAAFQRAVLIEWPRQGMYTVGFVTGEMSGRTQEIAGRRVLNVFVMSTPNPTTGFLVLVPEDQVHPLDMTVEDGLKLMMSGGIVAPLRPERPLPLEPGGSRAP